MNMSVRLPTRKTAEDQGDTRGLFVRTEKQGRPACGRGVVRRRLLRTIQRCDKQHSRLRLDLVNRAIRKRNNKHVSIRCGLNIGRDAEIFSDQQALALGLVKLIDVVGHAISQSWITEREVLSIRIQLEPEQEPVEQRRTRRAYTQISFHLRAESPSPHEANRRRRDCVLPTEFGIDILRSGQPTHLYESLLWEALNIARGPARLLGVS